MKVQRVFDFYLLSIHILKWDFEILDEIEKELGHVCATLSFKKKNVCATLKIQGYGPKNFRFGI